MRIRFKQPDAKTIEICFTAFIVFILAALFFVKSACSEEIVYDKYDVAGLRQVEKNQSSMWTNEKIAAVLSEPGAAFWVSSSKPAPSDADLRKAAEAQGIKEHAKSMPMSLYPNCIKGIKATPDYAARIKFLQDTAGDAWRESAKYDKLLAELVRSGIEKCADQAAARDEDMEKKS